MVERGAKILGLPTSGAVGAQKNGEKGLCRCLTSQCEVRKMTQSAFTMKTHRGRECVTSDLRTRSGCALATRVGGLAVR